MTDDRLGKMLSNLRAKALDPWVSSKESIEGFALLTIAANLEEIEQHLARVVQLMEGEDGE
jgi:hypothetical protein